ncbi:MAG: methyltransferase domain-containing protein [Candidatus Hydrogenedentota bacterium]|nr:MAG: methyltransferase domain-containing protein [Candidatus Hydrogenedentota bacterium]
MSMERAERLRNGVRNAYSTAADRPEAKHPFPVGRHFAESLGYPQDMLSDLPSVSVEAFAGVSDVAVFAEIPVDSRVLDLGCGAGLDSLIVARGAGPGSRIIGIDFSDAMLVRARQAVIEAGLENLRFFKADAENLPVKDGSIDIALINGIFNLNPARDAIFRELSRVVRQGGAVYAAELILKEPLPRKIQESETNWFA